MILTLVTAPLQAWILARVYRPKFEVTTENAPPCSVMVAWADRYTGMIKGNALYLRIFIKNVGTATAQGVEVYAERLYLLGGDGSRDWVRTFPSMNLNWANTDGSIAKGSMSPEMGWYCDVCHITDPAPAAETSLTFNVHCPPNHGGHIVRKRKYQLEVLVAAQNCFPIRCTLEIVHEGKWNSDEATMLGELAYMKVVSTCAVSPRK